MYTVLFVHISVTYKQQVNLSVSFYQTQMIITDHPSHILHLW